MKALHVTAFTAAWTALCGAAYPHPPQEAEAPRYGVVRTMLPPQSFATEALAILDFDGNGTPDAYLAGQLSFATPSPWPPPPLRAPKREHL